MIFGNFPKKNQNQTPPPLPGHPRTRPLGKTCTVMGPDLGFAYAPISGLWQVRIFFFSQIKMSLFVEKHDLGSKKGLKKVEF